MPAHNGFFIGTRKGLCPLCMDCKTLVILTGGISACRDCLDISTGILKAAQEELTTNQEILEKLRNHNE